jgi:hypothetical protein
MKAANNAAASRETGIYTTDTERYATQRKEIKMN